VPVALLPFYFGWIATCLAVAFGEAGLIGGLVFLGIVLFISMVDVEAFLFVLAFCIAGAVALALSTAGPFILLAVSVIAFVIYGAGSVDDSMTYSNETVWEGILGLINECGVAFMIGMVPVGIAVFKNGPETTLQITILVVNVLGFVVAMFVGYRAEQEEKARKASKANA
jgi:hypothetical protein